MRLLAVALLASLLGPTALAADDFRVILREGQAPAVSGAYGISATLVPEEPGERIVVRLSGDPVAKPQVVGSVVHEGYFSIERPRQMVPEADGQFLVEVPGAVEGRDASARVVNITTAGATVTFRVALPLDPTTGKAILSLTRDVEAPGFTLGNVTSLNHYSFQFRTATDEYALADLRIRPADGGEEVPFPTSVYALQQTFPVQGLDAETAYLFHVLFRDWAGNMALSGERNVTTPPEVTGPPPVVLTRSPAPNATLADPPGAIEATFLPGSGAIHPEDVRLFVDLVEVSADAARSNSSVRWVPPAPLAPGLHRASLELRDSGGGKLVDTWRFTVAGEESSPGLPAGPLLLLLATAAFGARRRAGRGRRLA